VNVALVAEESAGIQALRLLLERGHDVVAVLAAQERGDQRGATVAATARSLGLPLWPSRLVRDPALGGRLRGEGVDLLLNVHALHIVHPDVLAAARIGSFNLHPGPLPGYAGLNAPSWAILLGETSHAATLHWMVPEVDAGPIAYVAKVPIGPRDTGLSLSAACVRAGLPLVSRLLEDADRDPAAIPRKPQGPGPRRYFGRSPPFAGRLPWGLAARQVVDLVRAADYTPLPSPWGNPVARLAGREVAVVRASRTDIAADRAAGYVGPSRAGARLVAAADEWVAVERIRVHGKRADPVEALPEGERFELTSDERLSGARL
jgi:methionyl-tRNA formyltransferase